MSAQRLGLVATQMSNINFRVPPDTTIVDVSPHVQFIRNLLIFKVKHPDLREISESHYIPYVRPIWDGDTFIRWEEHEI